MFDRLRPGLPSMASVPSFLRAVVVPRAMLLVNHVVAGEPAAVARLRPMAGRTIEFRLADLPTPLARAAHGMTEAVVRVTPAGLLEWVEGVDAEPAPPSDLVVTVDASNPLATGLRVVGGARPAVRIEGDAALAAEVSWLLEHLRWDLEDDIARLTGPAVAHELARFAKVVKPALARFAAAAAELAVRLGPTPTADGQRDAAAPGSPPGSTPR